MDKGGSREEMSRLEERLSELQRVAGELESVPDEQLSGELERALSLLGEINAELEEGISGVEDGQRETQRRLEGWDASEFDRQIEATEEPGE